MGGRGELKAESVGFAVLNHTLRYGAYEATANPPSA